MNKWLRQIPIGCVVFGLLFTAGQGIAADIKERSIKLGYVLPEDHPLGLGAKKWSELLAQKSGGKIKARTYPAGAIGGDTQMISSLQGGIQDPPRSSAWSRSSEFWICRSFSAMKRKPTRCSMVRSGRNCSPS